MLSGLKLKHRLFLPNGSYIVMLVVVAFLFLRSSNMVTALQQSQQELDALSASIRDVALATTDYMEDKTTFGALKSLYDSALEKAGSVDLGVDLAATLNQMENAEALKQDSKRIESEIVRLTSLSTQQSNGFIQQVSEKLANAETQAQVTTLERQVIVGANMNTTANYEVRLLFDKMKQDAGAKDELTRFLDMLMSNVEQDIERLTGTPFAGMAQEAKKANEEIKTLVEEFVANTEGLQAIRISAAADVQNAIEAIDRIGAARRQEFF